MKKELKIWNVEHFGNLERRETQVEKELKLELKEEGDLEEKELETKKWLQEEFWNVATCNESLLRQKSRMKWLVDGDTNSKFFHDNVN